MPVDAADIEGDALRQLRRAKVDPAKPRADAAIVVARSLKNVRARVNEKLRTPRCRRIRNPDGSWRYELDMPPGADAAVHEDTAHEVGEARVPNIGSGIGRCRSYTYLPKTIENDSTHYGDCIAMAAPAFREEWDRADFDLPYLAEVFGVSETAVARRAGELIMPTVLIVRGQIQRWQCEGWGWLSDRVIKEAALGAYRRWATPVVLTDTPRATAVFIEPIE